MGISIETSKELTGANLAFFLAVLGAALAAFGALIIVGTRRASHFQASIQRVGCGQTVPGRVWRVIGTVRSAQPVVAPISGIRCAHWRVCIWSYVSHHHVGRKDDVRYEEVGRVEEAADWWLEDETGRIAVDADKADFNWKGLTKSFTGLLTPAPSLPVYDDLLRKAGVSRVDCDFVEQLITLDQKLLAQGMVEQFPKGAYLNGGTDLHLDPGLREDRIGPSRVLYVAGAALVGLGAAMLVEGLLTPREPEPELPPPPPGWQPAPGRKAPDPKDLPLLPNFDERRQ